jgi:hypothetical protein
MGFDSGHLQMYLGLLVGGAALYVSESLVQHDEIKLTL